MKSTETMDVLVHEEDGSMWAEVPSMPGVFAAGDTLDELWESLREAIELVTGGKVKITNVEPPTERTERRELVLTAC